MEYACMYWKEIAYQTKSISLFFHSQVFRKQICHKMHFRRLRLCCVHVWKDSYSDNRETLFSQRCKAIENIPPSQECTSSPHSTSAYQAFVWGQANVFTEHHGDRSRTRNNHGSHYGQHFARLWTRATSWSTVVANKAVKQNASVQLPTSHVLSYATVEETAMKTSLLTAFESSSQLCVSCCNFISVHVMNLLSPL